MRRFLGLLGLDEQGHRVVRSNRAPYAFFKRSEGVAGSRAACVIPAQLLSSIERLRGGNGRRLCRHGVCDKSTRCGVARRLICPNDFQAMPIARIDSHTAAYLAIGEIVMTDKTLDLAGPGIGNYDALETILPDDYCSLLNPKETQKALFAAKNCIEENLCTQLNLMPVTVPLIVDAESGVNDYLDRDGSRSPVQFHISNDHEQHPIDAQVVQAATKWKRMALAQFDMNVGEGLLTDMRAVRKDYFLDHDHSAYVDQWDWELRITDEQRNLQFLKTVVEKIWVALRHAESQVQKLFPQLKTDRYPNLPERLRFIHAEDILEKYPEIPRKERETAILQEHSAVFIYGIGATLKDGYPHELRAADYDDWITETTSEDGRSMHGLNGDILVWNPVTKRRHELSSMGIRVNAESLKRQLEITKQLDFLGFPYHQAIINNEIPLSIGGGIGQSRVYMSLLKKAHLGEVSVSVWPEVLKDMCRSKNIQILE